MSRWRVAQPAEEQVAELASALRLRPLTARVLLARGLSRVDDIARFLAPRLGDLRPPVGIADLDRAAERIETALSSGQRIGVFGDYDVDGVTTAAVLSSSLRQLGADVVPRVASRFSGYGLPPAEIVRFAESGCGLIITGDCGTSDHEALAVARERGIDVIVIDHHQVPEGPCGAYALINPHRHDDQFAFKGLASCGVAFYLMAALRTRLRGRQHAAASTFDPRTLLDLVALGTIADLVPLTAENRILVAAGLREITQRRRPGLRALARIAEIDPARPITAIEVGFRLTPRLNAPGRLGEAQAALELLLAADDAEATQRAEAVDGINRERQRIQEEVWQAAIAAAEAQRDASAIVVGEEGWHPGVVGIVAAKLVERFGKPAAAIAFTKGVGRGSLRTVGGFHLQAALVRCAEHLQAHGGHAGAAGMTISRECFEAFRAAFVAAASVHQQSSDLPAALEADAGAELTDLDLPQLEELARLAPFGKDNGEPTLAFSDLQVRSSRVVGQNHLQLVVSKGDAVMDGIGFGMAAQAPPDGSAIDALACAEIDNYRGYQRPRLRFRRILAAGS
ncbi:MAG TPA: single-stranded-DNA-specific exonuclease RecJ [Polyangia bacterium]